ncbi:MAG: acetyl-CoA decarbonylase/synthase complex subunit gamma [Candidatus Omnitrophica bacterium]|nr:acetyl-CoA decarbonylase/synthase complex subunit gamma [Candidatus Omnitrophota bacterium]MCM8810240.1 acetyl-CoA decarbonylase/synthase complex subunit gamma [Candidatus Omnitrophota bacterium]
MALKPLDIFKYLPKTNCKECGFPTCLAFAMQVAIGKVELTKCPYVSEEGKKQLEAESAPPIKTITVGNKEKINLGGETVLYRHEKTFYNPTGIGVLIKEDMSDEEIDNEIKNLIEFKYERVGLVLKGEFIGIEDKNLGKFINIVEKSFNTGKNLILISDNIENLKKAVDICKEVRPIIFSMNISEHLINLAKENQLPIIIRGNSFEEITKNVEQVQNKGIEDIIIYPENKEISELFKNVIYIRRGAILKRIRSVGFPILIIPEFLTDDYLKEGIYAGIFVAKYGSIVLLSKIRGEVLFPLLIERLNIYTDPQRPMTTTEGIYEIGKPNENSPVFVTTNFSLTYFIVSGEIENSKVPSYLLIQDTEGLSVLTAWAADKFNAETIANLVKKTKIGEKLNKKVLIIPGVVAQIYGELQEALPEWKIVLGPREAAHIPSFLKNVEI